MHPDRRIAIFLTEFHPRGGEIFMLDLAIALAARGCGVDFVVLRTGSEFPSQLPASVRVVNLSPRRMRAALPRLRQYLQHERPQAILATSQYTAILVLLASLALRPRPRVVLRVGTMFSEIFPRQRKFFDRWVIPFLIRSLYRRADAVIAVSRGIADDIAFFARIPPSRINVIYNPKPVDEIRAHMDAPVPHPWFAAHDSPIIVAVGRLVAQKDFPTLIRAFASLSRDSARLAILGGGDAAPLAALAAELGCADTVAILGNIENPYAYMARADLFVSTSSWEGMPNALLEAMICGLPIVAADCSSGPREILAPDTSYTKRLAAGQGIEHAAYGILTAPADPAGTAEALKLLLADSTLRTEYARKSLERAKDFSMEALLPFYEEILGLTPEIK